MRIPLLFLSFVLLVCSCSKDIPVGCTDELAVNYTQEAEVDDGSCEYIASSVIWWDQQTAQEIIATYNVFNLRFFINDEDVGVSALNQSWIFPPVCGDSGAITCTKYLGTSTTGTAEYRVEEFFGGELFSGTIDFEVGVCRNAEIEL